MAKSRCAKLINSKKFEQTCETRLLDIFFLFFCFSFETLFFVFHLNVVGCYNVICLLSKERRDLVQLSHRDLPSKCLLMWEERSQRPGKTATISALVAVPLKMPIEDTLCPLCCRTWPLKCTEKSSGSELIPTKCHVILECAHTLRSGEDQEKYYKRTSSQNL